VVRVLVKYSSRRDRSCSDTFRRSYLRLGKAPRDPENGIAVARKGKFATWTWWVTCDLVVIPGITGLSARCRAGESLCRY
jgi:hypothetical protein